jgi:hypothetical protein
MARLAREVPVFALELGTDVEAVPAAIARVCEEIRG